MRLGWAIAACAIWACERPAPAPTAPAAAPPPGDAGAVAAAAAAPAALPAIDVNAPPPPSRPRNYEVLARAGYESDPSFEQRWPVEFHIRICEGLTQDLSRAFTDLGGNLGPDLFAGTVEFALGTPGLETPSALGLRHSEWPEAPPRTLEVAAVRVELLRYLSAFRFVEHALVKLKTNPRIPEKGKFEATAALEVLGRETTGAWRRDVGKVHMAFEKKGRDWRITRFVADHLTTDRRDLKIYEDVAPAWTAQLDPGTRERLLERSVADEVLTRRAGSGTPAPQATDAHPGVAVVDIDGDGWDDLYVWDMLGPAVLLRNVGGTHFEDVSRATGLDVSDISAAAFADLDGKDAIDAVIGRWTGPSEVKLGQAATGKTLPLFTSAPLGRKVALPASVASLALADVDRDGLVDVFFGTAAQDYHLEAVGSGKAPRQGADGFVDMLGPPDTLLLNRGDGGFVDGTAGAGLASRRRNSLAPSFADFDGDGWVDLYVGNDFASADLYVNEKGRFRPISKESGARDIVFGMGASWGDVDGDGDLDLYASAMQSSAGQRIMSDEKAFASNLDAAARSLRREAARGNTLLVNQGGRSFTDGTAKGQPWEKLRGANWSYGSQFVDVDQDGRPDVFAPNGFFTNPTLPDDGLTRDL